MAGRFDPKAFVNYLQYEVMCDDDEDMISHVKYILYCKQLTKTFGSKRPSIGVFINSCVLPINYVSEILL